jgi:hypothetical protein
MPLPKNVIFYFFCSKNRQDFYKLAIDRIGYHVVFFTSIKELVRISLGIPPTAVLLDIQTCIKAGLSETDLLHNLLVTWPILRCTVTQNLFVTASSNNPPYRGTLDDAIYEMIKNFDAWKNPAYNRHHVRLDVECRMKIRRADLKCWARANCQNISSGGFFAVTYDPPEKGCDVEIQLHDLADDTITFTAKSMWVRRWDDSTQLPGLGIAIETGAAHPAYIQALQSNRFAKAFYKE